MQQPGPTSHTTASQAQPAALSGYSMNFNMFPPAPGLVPPGMLLHQHQQAHHQAFLYSQPHPQHYHHLIHQNTNNMYLPGGPAPSLPVNAGPRASATPPVDPFLASGQGQHHTGWSAVPTAYHAAYGLPTATSYYSHHHQYGPQPPFAMVPHFYGAQWGAGPPPGGYTVTYVHHIGVPPPNSQDPAGLPPPPVQATPAPPVSATAFAEPRRPEQDTSDSNVQTNSNEASKGTKSNSKSERNSGDSKSQPSSNSELTYADVLRAAVSEDAAVLEELVDAGRVSAIADLLLKKYSVTYRHLEVTAFALSHPEQMERQRKLWEGKQIPIPDGIYTTYYLWHRSHTAGTRRELCMKHNGRAKNGEPYDRCLYGDARCKFRHECAFCRLPDHGWFAVGRCSARLRLQDELAALGLVNYSDTPTSVTPEEQADSDEAAGAERRRSAVSPAATGSKTTTSGRSRLSSGSPADGNGSSGSKVRHNFVKVEADTAVAVPVQKPKAARPPAAEKEGDDSGDGSSVNGRGLAVRWYTAGLTQQDNAKVERAARLLFGSGPRGPAAAATSSGGSASVASATASVAAAGGAATLGTELRHRTATQHRGALAAAGASASTTPSQPMTGSSSDPPTASERNDDKDTPPSSASGNCAADGSRDIAANGTAPSDSTGDSSRSHSDSTSSPAAQASP